MPRGFRDPSEPELCKVDTFLSSSQRVQMRKWWLAHPRGARTPVWDIASTATIGGRGGLVLVEAKAHAGELSEGGKLLTTGASANSEANHARIEGSLAEASRALDQVVPGWNLNSGSHYQLANRFAWSWKLASSGVPVVLVYLGFLNAEEMGDLSFRSAAHWEDALRTHSAATIPPSAWNKELDVDGTPLRAMTSSIELHWEMSKAT